MISEQKLNEILGGIINNYKMKGSISTNALCDIMEKYDTNPNQIDYVYKSIGEAGIQIVDEDERDRELFEQALSDIGLDDTWIAPEALLRPPPLSPGWPPCRWSQ